MAYELGSAATHEMNKGKSKRGRESADGSQMVKSLASLLAGRGRASCRPLLVLALALLSALPASGFLGVECAVVAGRRTGGGVGAVRGGQLAASGRSAGSAMHLRPPPDPVCASIHAPPCCANGKTMQGLGSCMCMSARASLLRNVRTCRATHLQTRPRRWHPFPLRPSCGTCPTYLKQVKPQNLNPLNPRWLKLPQQADPCTNSVYKP